MHIESIELKNFRNYKSLSMKFDQETNILYGDNAQGKTNILEAIYLCGTSKSHKASKDKDMIHFQEDEAHIRMVVNKEGILYKIDMHLRKNKAKGIAINGVPIKKARELFGIVNMVFFSPEDLNIIKDGPAERRRFMDVELCQLNKLYLLELANYNKILSQRNKLLKDIFNSSYLKDTLEIWDEQLISYGVTIIRMRQNFIENLNQVIQSIHRQLTGEKENIEIVYEANVLENEFKEQLQKNQEKDCRYKTTSIGPHRDDMCVKINNIDIRKYGSQGQQRTAALSLKLSEIYLIENSIHDTPILLLDDVLSELDSSRQNYLLDSIHNIQTIITCTGLDEFVNNRFKINKIFKVIEGCIVTENEDEIS